MALGSQVLFHSFESLTLLSCKMRHLNRELFGSPANRFRFSGTALGTTVPTHKVMEVLYNRTVARLHFALAFQQGWRWPTSRLTPV